MRATAAILAVILFVILGGVTPESGIAQPYATDTPLVPSGFRGIDPPLTPQPGVPRARRL
ncbi:MAG: hypothetical protein UZ13_02066 [Chloroflexi bacterium OLB13]|nr:MAG: hypothetical protein UZ13_02066 [Chloroflexi bacterium OLB13]